MKDINPKLYGFTFATGDVHYLDYGGTWVRHVGTREYHFIDLINWEGSVGEREAKEIGETYCIDLRIVDLDKLSQDQIVSAFESCGQVPEEAAGNDEWIAETCMQYGAYAPVSSVNTSNFHKTFRALAKESREISRNVNRKRAVMNRRVNRIGSTANEFMQGDLDSAVVRGVIADKPEANLMFKLGYGRKS